MCILVIIKESETAAIVAVKLTVSVISKKIISLSYISKYRSS
jgi:predicted HTH domain antitoxin